jgi:hypothetical protein
MPTKTKDELLTIADQAVETAISTLTAANDSTDRVGHCDCWSAELARKTLRTGSAQGMRGCRNA